MITKLHDKLAEIRSAREEGEKGFTLIELLVVVIIIGILAAIAIPIFLGQQESARDASLQTDLRNAKTAVIAWQVDNPTETALPTLDTATLGDYGFTLSTGNAIAQQGTGGLSDNWVLIGTRGGSTNAFTISAQGGIEPATAPSTAPTTAPE